MSKIDTPIMLLFFNRPDTLQKLFDWVRKVKPKQLFLVQDGARPNNQKDIEGINECRKVVESVDWECEVRKNYSSVNLTCDQREFSGIDWCFQYVDKLIILEDDILPSLSFYDFCGELLEKYKDDERIHIISGFNRCNRYTNSPYDYVFSKTGAGIGWATWKRVWEQVKTIKERELFNSKEEFDYYNKLLNQNAIKGSKDVLISLERSKRVNEKLGKVTSWEIFVGGASELNDSLTITPTKNLIKYNGITENATHCYSNELLLSNKTRKLLTQSAYDLDFPIKHPPYIARDKEFELKDRKAIVYKFKIVAKIELFFNIIKAGRWDIIFKKFKRKSKRK